MYQVNFGLKDGKNHSTATKRWVGHAQIRLRFHLVQVITEINVVKQRIKAAIPKAAKMVTSSQMNLFLFFLSQTVSPAVTKKKNRITTAGEVKENELSGSGA